MVTLILAFASICAVVSVFAVWVHRRGWLKKSTIDPRLGVCFAVFWLFFAGLNFYENKLPLAAFYVVLALVWLFNAWRNAGAKRKPPEPAA